MSQTNPLYFGKSEALAEVFRSYPDYSDHGVPAASPSAPVDVAGRGRSVSAAQAAENHQGAISKGTSRKGPLLFLLGLLVMLAAGWGLYQSAHSWMGPLMGHISRLSAELGNGTEPSEVEVTVVGPATAKDTATIVIDDTTLLLAGIEAIHDETYLTDFNDYLASSGDVTCHVSAETGTAVCLDQDGDDLAEILVYSGFALVSDISMKNLMDAQARAVEDGNGVWGNK